MNSKQESKSFGTGAALSREIDDYELARSFTLSDRDLGLIWQSRGAHNRLGMAMQICWLRHLGWQPSSFRKVSISVTRFIAKQLRVKSQESIARYHGVKPQQFRLHAQKAREHLGWVRCGDDERKQLHDHLHPIALQHDIQAALMTAAITWLFESKICRPKVSELTRLVRHVRATATDEIIQRINQKLSSSLKLELERFVETPEAGLPSELQKYLSAPPTASAPELVVLMKRITELRRIGIESLDWTDVNANRLRSFANAAERLRPRDLRTSRSDPDRAHAIIASALGDALLRLNDDGIEMHEQLMLNLRSRAKAARDADLLANQGMIMRLIGLLHQILLLILQPRRLLKAIGSAIFRVFKKGFLRQALAECAALLEPAAHDGLFYLRNQYSTFRRFGPHFLATMKFEYTEAGRSTVEAVAFLREVNARQRAFVDPPMTWLSKKMSGLLHKKEEGKEGGIDRALWEIFLHERIVRDLRAGDLWVKHSREYLPLELDLAVSASEKARFLKAFPHMASADTFLTFLHEAYLKIMTEANKVLVKPDATESDPALPIVDMTLDPEPPEVGPIRRKLFGLVPLRQLPQVLRQVLRWVNFLEPFRERVEGDLRIDDLYDRLLFVLVGEGCNIGLETMAAATNRYSYNQLAHIASRCLRPEVIKKAIARVIDYHQKMHLTPLWGKGIWSSADGQLFPISHRSLRSRRHPKAPFAMRVVNLVTHVLDTLVSYSSVLLQTTSHENRYHLDGLLHHEADVHPRKHTSDTAGYTDVTFGLTSMLRIFFAPRIRSPRETRLYFWDKKDAEVFPNVFSYLHEKVSLKQVAVNWDAIVNLVAAAWCGITPPSRSMRKLEAMGERSPLYRAIQGIGRVEKTIVFLSYAISPSLQSDVIRQNNKTEHSNQLQDRLFFGNKGVIRQNDSLDIYTRMLCLRLLANVIILYNTAWLQAAVTTLRDLGEDLPDKMLRHIWPTATSHINLLGYFIVDDTPELQVDIENLHIGLRERAQASDAS